MLFSYWFTASLSILYCSFILFFYFLKSTIFSIIIRYLLNLSKHVSAGTHGPPQINVLPPTNNDMGSGRLLPQCRSPPPLQQNQHWNTKKQYLKVPQVSYGRNRSHESSCKSGLNNCS